MFFWALRPGEVLASSARDESGRALGVDDVGTCTNQVIIYLRGSKTDQRGQGQRITLNCCPDVQICPVNMLGQFLHLRPLVGDLLFIREDRSPLGIYQFRTVVLRALGGMGFAASVFGLHSF